MFSVYIIYERWSHITSKITVISLKISGVLFFSIGTTTTVRRTRIMKIALDSLYVMKLTSRILLIYDSP